MNFAPYLKEVYAIYRTSSGETVGTGFHFCDRFFITCHHVIDGEVWGARNDETDLKKFYAEHRPADFDDMAVLEFPSNECSAICYVGSAAVGAQVWILGYNPDIQHGNRAVLRQGIVSYITNSDSFVVAYGGGGP
eukprot:TRINITY_DN3327_c0_g1_i1.p1 TRINITY_DN3327_c0_g1~~TRINITY_DN3327_c0_g1_i1.p1  ORF type:complete len:135 (+),score=21.20 TRINITY_DN3327_c0_g1_i1:62-466(+)